MSKAELLQRAARVLHVTKADWARAISDHVTAHLRSVPATGATARVPADPPRMVSSRIWARMRLGSVAALAGRSLPSR